jgi:acetyl-CoA acetyltransferase
VVTAQREWPHPTRAWRRDKVTVDEILNDETVTYPFTRQMCCVATYGGGALVLTSR